MKKEIRIRCWVDIDGEKFFGPGRAELLELIGETGSIAKAAKSMGMSYKKAWDMVNEMNTLGSKPYVVSHAGGDKGGGAQVTEAGNKMLNAYKNIVAQLDSIAIKNKDILKLV
jgi:molybdate transport system regulatory protein